MARTVSRTKETNPYVSTAITEVRVEGAGPSWLVDALWDAYIAAPGDAPTLQETTFDGGRGLLSFGVDDDAKMIYVFAITWIG